MCATIAKDDTSSGSPYNALHSLVSIVVSYVVAVDRKVCNFQSLPVTANKNSYVTLTLHADEVDTVLELKVHFDETTPTCSGFLVSCLEMLF